MKHNNPDFLPLNQITITISSQLSEQPGLLFVLEEHLSSHHKILRPLLPLVGD